MGGIIVGSKFPGRSTIQNASQAQSKSVGQAQSKSTRPSAQHTIHQAHVEFEARRDHSGVNKMVHRGKIAETTRNHFGVNNKQSNAQEAVQPKMCKIKVRKTSGPSSEIG